MIYNEDCLDTMRRIPDNSIDMICSDPPYGIAFKSLRTTHQREIINDSHDEWRASLPLWLAEFKRVLTPTGCCCCCCGGKTPVTAMFTLEAIKHMHLITVLREYCSVAKKRIDSELKQGRLFR